MQKKIQKLENPSQQLSRSTLWLKERADQIIRRIVSLRLSHSFLAGTVVTLVDLSSLALFVQVLGLTPQQANVPALVLGSLVQFFSHRHFVFLDAWRGQFSRQAILFGLSELAGVGLTALTFYCIVQWTPVHYLVARPLCSGIVYFGFSFPLWRLIFRVHPTDSSVEKTTSL